MLALTLSAADCNGYFEYLDRYFDGYFEYLDGYLDTDDKSLLLADQLVLRPVLTLTLSAAVARHSASRASIHKKRC